MFKYDPAKSMGNKAKHGIDFDAAQALWSDEARVERPTRQDAGEERRSLVIGRLAGKTWTAVTTKRGETIRIISARRSRDDEVEYYADQQRG